MFTKLSEYCAYPNMESEEQIQSLLQRFGPISVTINVKEHFLDLKAGTPYEKCELPQVEDPASPSMIMFQEVLLVGWDEKYWHLKNSFGPQWGDEGFFRMTRGDKSCGLYNPANQAPFYPAFAAIFE